MRRFLLPAALAGLIIGGAVIAADQERAFWGVFLDTSTMRSAGMPDMSEMLRNMPPEVLRNLPPEARAMMGGGAQRQITMRLWSPGIAPPEAKAEAFPPAGAKLGDKLPLKLWRPGEEEPGRSEGEPGEAVPVPAGKMTIKIYWGSSRTVKPGQPKVVEHEWAAMSPEEQARLKEMMSESSGLAYRPDWTTGYWPDVAGDSPTVADDARMAGTMRLETNYTGSTAVEIPDNVNFLDGIVFGSPNLSRELDLTKYIEFKWKEIANCLGFEAQIIGMEGQNTVIVWHAGEAEPRESGNADFMQMAEVRRLVDEQQFIAGNSTAMTVPAGIFADCDMANMMMTGYGTGAANDEGQPRARVQSRTRYNGMLGGKMMAGMGGGFTPPGFGQ